jgi:hypothetical protein
VSNRSAELHAKRSAQSVRPVASAPPLPSKPPPKFAIDDEVEEGGGDSSPEPKSKPFDATEGSMPFQKDALINVGHWMQKKNTHFFFCNRLDRDGTLLPRYLVIAGDAIMSLEAHKEKLNAARLKTWHSLLDVRAGGGGPFSSVPVVVYAFLFYFMHLGLEEVGRRCFLTPPLPRAVGENYL